jgi:biotin carboxyl carrier protein
MANPPLPLTPSASPITYGVVVHYGLDDLAVTGIIIDSYKRDQQYADTQEVQNQAGVTVGVRMTDFRVNVSVDGRVIEEDASGTAVSYTVKVGDSISENDNLVVLESDKAAMEIPSPKAGVVKSVLVQVGSSVKTGTALIELETAGAAAAPPAGPVA